MRNSSDLPFERRARLLFWSCMKAFFTFEISLALLRDSALFLIVMVTFFGFLLLRLLRLSLWKFYASCTSVIVIFSIGGDRLFSSP